MSSRNYKECLHDVAEPSANVDQGSPPTAFLDELIDVIAGLPDAVFAKTSNKDDIYTVMEPKLGPWTGLLQRRAVMCEVLRVLGGFEASWDWNTGVYMGPGGGTGRPEDEWETGVFQVSYNSMRNDASLKACVSRAANGATDNDTFLAVMKSDHALAVEYCARLLRFDTTWDAPINKGWVSDAAWPPAVQEFSNFLSAAGVSDGPLSMRFAAVSTTKAKKTARPALKKPKASAARLAKGKSKKAAKPAKSKERVKSRKASVSGKSAEKEKKSVKTAKKRK